MRSLHAVTPAIDQDLLDARTGLTSGIHGIQVEFRANDTELWYMEVGWQWRQYDPVRTNDYWVTMGRRLREEAR